MDAVGSALAAKVKKFGAAWVWVQGRCMDPLLVTGDRVRVVPCQDLVVGCLYCISLLDGKIAVHRFLGFSKGIFRFRGDRSGICDELNGVNVIGLVDCVSLGGLSHSIHKIRRGFPAFVLGCRGIRVSENGRYWYSSFDKVRRFVVAVVNKLTRVAWCLEDFAKAKFIGR